jgi:hypothetical protein
VLRILDDIMRMLGENENSSNFALSNCSIDDAVLTAEVIHLCLAAQRRRRLWQTLFILSSRKEVGVFSAENEFGGVDNGGVGGRVQGGAADNRVGEVGRGRQTITNHWVRRRKMMEQAADNESGWSAGGGDGRQTTINNQPSRSMGNESVNT